MAQRQWEPGHEHEREHGHGHGQGEACCGAAHEAHGGLGQSLAELSFERSLCGAAAARDLARLQTMLHRGADANQRDAAGYTALV